MKEYDVIIIGAGLSGLTEAALLSKRGKKVLLLDAQKTPGGSCGIFKRDGVIFEQGASMLYGFSERGFNPHRFVFNVLEEPITMIKHTHLYMIHFGEEDIIFYEDMERFLQELIRVFPDEEHGIRKFYREMSDLYEKVIAETPVFVSPDVLPKEQAMAQLKQHPVSYLKFLSFMNRSMKDVLRKYFKGEKILEFFDKLTSTYCYATVEEAPAVLGAVMFVDNHYGGSYYPAGSTLQLVGKLEKVIEENQGEVRYQQKVEKIEYNEQGVIGVLTARKEEYHAKQIVYSGNVWSLYETLLNRPCEKEYEPTYGSMVFYALIGKEAVPKDALPIEMFIQDKSKIAESEITTYLFSLDDTTLCPKEYHVLVAIGPSFKSWPSGYGEWYGTKKYQLQKERELERMMKVLEKRYQGLRNAIVYSELATPSTLEHYILKYKGAVAGPKQMLGQHMLKRQHTKTSIPGLYCCGEGTVMGTGTPAVTVSGIAAANLVLRESGGREYTSADVKKDYVTVIKPPYRSKNTNPSLLCDYCEQAKCQSSCPYRIPIGEINRKLAVDNMIGAKKLLNQKQALLCKNCIDMPCQKVCKKKDSQNPVPIKQIIESIMK